MLFKSLSIASPRGFTKCARFCTFGIFGAFFMAVGSKTIKLKVYNIIQSLAIINYRYWIFRLLVTFIL